MKTEPTEPILSMISQLKANIETFKLITKCFKSNADKFSGLSLAIKANENLIKKVLNEEFSIVNIGTSKGNIVGVEIPMSFKEISFSDIYDIAELQFEDMRMVSIQGWCDVTDEY